MEQKKKALEQAQKKALSSSMLYELRREYDTAPEEIRVFIFHISQFFH